MSVKAVAAAIEAETLTVTGVEITASKYLVRGQKAKDEQNPSTSSSPKQDSKDTPAKTGFNDS